jgi:hypothetical protein
MKSFVLILAALISSPAYSQRVAPVRGIGTQTCKTIIATSEPDKPFQRQGYQWILGYMTGYFRQANDDPSRTISDDLLVRSIQEICSSNMDKTIDEAVTIAISSFPVTEVKKP